MRYIQGDFFFNWHPPNLLGLAPPKFSKLGNPIHFPRHIFFLSWGVPICLFLNLFLTDQHF